MSTPTIPRDAHAQTPVKPTGDVVPAYAQAIMTGADGAVVDSEAALADALAAAQRSSRLTVIAARIDPSTYVEQFNALREL